MSSASVNARLQSWWDTQAQPVFAHIDYKRLGGEHNLILGWRRVWLRRFCKDGRCNGARVVEYGIGAGLLGEHLLRNFSAAHYDGIDISERSLAAARARLALAFGAHQFAMHSTSVDFTSLKPAIFISQAVIQHFPSLNYTTDFLERVNRCGAEYLMLQTRNGTTAIDAELIPGRAGRWVEKRLKYATLLTTADLVPHLDRYDLEWCVNHDHGYVFHAFRRRREGWRFTAGSGIGASSRAVVCTGSRDGYSTQDGFSSHHAAHEAWWRAGERRSRIR